VAELNKLCLSKTAGVVFFGDAFVPNENGLMASADGDSTEKGSLFG
jgi:hypothetical protein